ncbi:MULTISPECIES: adenosine deaminase [Nonomuraea]|uniref:Adenosine deaminase n=1 Tax=Nonomuraea mangrovi TaxID=2316207 RepID=A0ABW4SLR1_9ACTN
MRDIARLPKAHLHVHLESTVRPATLRELGVQTPRPDVFTGFRQFADHNARVRGALRTPEHFRRIAREFCADEAAQGTRYAEVTFTAASHGERLGDLEMPLLAVLEGLAEGEAEHGIRCALILDHSRRRPAERLWQTLKLATAHDEVIAIGLAGDETYPLTPFADVLEVAREAGLHLVHHAGETAGPDSIREALEVGHAERLGHGIRVLEDPALVAELRERRVPLEVCPFSNVLLGIVPSRAEHPLPRLRREGLVVTLNTDGETSLLKEYADARDSDETLAELAAASVTASFAPAPLKTELLEGISAWLSAPAG